jgi:hypothetical protein
MTVNDDLPSSAIISHHPQTIRADASFGLNQEFIILC